MPISPLKRGDRVLRMESHNGFFDKPLASRIKCKKNENFSWDFHRENSNHAYLSSGKIEYGGVCENNLIISSREINSLNDVKNSFIFSYDQYLEIVPISDFERIKRLGRENLSGKIKYNIPLKVKKREEIFNHDLDRIKSILKNSYGINPDLISPILSGRIKEGKYLVKGVDGKEYVFKYRGKNEQEIELNSEILSRLESHFPKAHKRIDNFSYGIGLQDGYYGLEDFVKGVPIGERNLEYLGKIGKKIAFLHNNLDFFLETNPGLNFIKRGEDFNESNILSMYFDISNKFSGSNLLIPFIEEIINQNLSSRMRKIPTRIIHGDVNSSNVIDTGKELVIIDSETFGQDKRLKEFISPLLLEGNMGPSNYLKGSLPLIINQYNKYSQTHLSQEEISILPSLLQAAILKSHVVREIRRENKTKNGLQRAIENLEKVKGDSNVY